MNLEILHDHLGSFEGPWTWSILVIFHFFIANRFSPTLIKYIMGFDEYMTSNYYISNYSTTRPLF